MTIKNKEINIILYNIRSAENVGSIFRTADAASVSKIYCAGYTPAPYDAFGRKQNKIAKSALGAEKTVLWERVRATGALIRRLKKEGFFIVAVEQDKNSVDYRVYAKHRASHKRIAFVFGNEIDGISPNILSVSDSIVEIPMRGKKESLNVAVAVGIILFC